MMRKLLGTTLILCALLFVGMAFGQEQAVNLEIDFSDGTVGWRVFGSGTLSVSTEQARTGTKSLKMSDRTDGWHSAAVDMDQVLADGGTYKFSIYVRLASESEEPVYGHVTMGENLLDGTANYKWLSEDVLLSSDEWVLIESDPYTFNAENVETAWFYVEVSHENMDYYLDDFRIVGNKLLKTTYEQAFDKDIPALRDALGDYFHFGAATSPHFLNEQNVYASFIAHHYGVLVAGNSMKPDALQPSRGRFNWKDADLYVEFAERHGMLVRGHTLLWHNQVPNWFFLDSTAVTQPAPREQLLATLENHIKTVVGRYKGRIYSWDVVNEVLNDSGNIRGLNDDSKWKSIIGDVDGDGYESDYIELAFKFAREADPDAVLIINDYGIESRGAKRTGMYNLVKRMLEKGVPVDGVGLQMHISVYGPTPKEIEESIELFASLKEYNPDFVVEVTEMDMSVYRWMEEQKEITPELIELQAERYGEIFEIFRRQAEKGNLSTVVMWGVGDMDSWLEHFPIRGRGDAGLLFDKQMQAKPAYYKILDPDQPWYVTEASLKGALKLIENEDRLIGHVLPGTYSIGELKSGFGIDNLSQIWLGKGFVLEVYPDVDSENTVIYVGDDEFFDFEAKDFGEKIVLKTSTAQNLTLNRPVDASHRPDRANRAVDGELLSSWTVNDEPPYWLSVDLGKEYTLTNWVVYHRGAGGLSDTIINGPLNTAEFSLQISDDNKTWQDVDVVEDNVLAKTERALSPIQARYVRLLITGPSSLPANREAIVYEFEVYGLES